MESTVTLNMLASVYLEGLSKLPSLLFSTSDPTRGLSSSVLSLPGMEMCRHWCCFSVVFQFRKVSYVPITHQDTVNQFAVEYRLN
jgi:hypothetical protein